MKFVELVAAAKSVHYTCFTWQDGKFRQYVPDHYVKGVTQLDQTGMAILKSYKELLDMEVNSFQPTAYNYMNVYLY